MLFGKHEEKKPYFDLHCHILPGMDDGSESGEQSAAMFRMMLAQGCQGLIATSHYYDVESIQDFLDRREKAYQNLLVALEENHLDKYAFNIGLGAEAAYHPYLSGDEDLEKLCFRNPVTGNRTKYLLIEMPFEKWTPQVLSDVREIIHVRNLVPIIAHLERFYAFNAEETIDELLDMDVIVQMNAGALAHRHSRRLALKMVRTGVTQVLGTDSHNTDSRRPNMADGLAVLQKNDLTEEADEILANNALIYQMVMRESFH